MLRECCQQEGGEQFGEDWSQRALLRCAIDTKVEKAACPLKNRVAVWNDLGKMKGMSPIHGTHKWKQKAGVCKQSFIF